MQIVETTLKKFQWGTRIVLVAGQAPYVLQSRRKFYLRSALVLILYSRLRLRWHGVGGLIHLVERVS